MALHLSLIRKLALSAAAALLIAACADPHSASMRSSAAIPQRLLAEMQAKGMTRTSPILVRVYKKESELEVWKQTASGRYALLKSYPICRWSGQLGPKKTEGDRQVPEGFYSVGPSQLNPNSKYYLSFDVGYPNNFDQQLGRAGGDIMVHGSCSSRGCFAMTDNQIAEIYAVAREALSGGQSSFQIQSLPFRMTAENFARQRRSPNLAFWQNLKEGTDNFEVTKQPVAVEACGGKYVFNGQGACASSSPDPAVVAAVQEKRKRDETEIASLAISTPAVNYLYEDGGSNPVFADRMVDSTAIAGRDRPYYTVKAPTVVALAESGAPATEADARAARVATYSAAETLLMSEAAVARRPVGPQNPTAVAVRQQTVYAKLMGSKMPEPEPVAPPKLAPAPVVMADAGSSGDEAPLYSRLLGFASFGGQAAPQPVKPPLKAPATTGSVRSKVAAPILVAKAAEPEQAPFYKRWLGLGGDDSQAVVQPEDVVAPADVPLPPARKRSKSKTAGIPAQLQVPLPPQLGRDYNAYAELNQ
jgi:murein L,D-transpeptidase YafK